MNGLTFQAVSIIITWFFAVCMGKRRFIKCLVTRMVPSMNSIYMKTYAKKRPADFGRSYIQNTVPEANHVQPVYSHQLVKVCEIERSNKF